MTQNERQAEEGAIPCAEVDAARGERNRALIALAQAGDDGAMRRW